MITNIYLINLYFYYFSLSQVFILSIYLFILYSYSFFSFPRVSELRWSGIAPFTIIYSHFSLSFTFGIVVKAVYYPTYYYLLLIHFIIKLQRGSKIIFSPFSPLVLPTWCTGLSFQAQRKKWVEFPSISASFRVTCIAVPCRASSEVTSVGCGLFIVDCL